MPLSAVKLADRSYDEKFVKVLEAEEQRQLFRGNLPVTFVLDCNRRVRWAKFEQLTEADFEDLERHLDQLHAELAEAGFIDATTHPGTPRDLVVAVRPSEERTTA
jgi:hypothetical protein